jgi:hypothetical protein
MSVRYYIIKVIKNKCGDEDRDVVLDPIIKTQPGSYNFTIEILKKIKGGGNTDEHGEKFFSDIYPNIYNCVCVC